MINLKKIILTTAVLLTSLSLYAEDVNTIDIDTSGLQGRVKAGVSLGYPTGITAGYRFAPPFEMNAILGTDYNSFILGLNGLFTLAKLRIEGEVFPFSLGPAVIFDTHDHHHDYHHDDNHVHLDILCVARIEYDFKQIPLNLFLEAGAGIRTIEHIGFAGSCALGVRYIF